MRVRLLIFTVFVSFLLNASFLFSQENKSDICLNFDIDGFESNKWLDIKILSPEKRIVWNYSIIGTDKSIEVKASNWYRAPGLYKILVNVDYKDTVRKITDSLDFEMRGNEYEAVCSMWFTNWKDKKTRYLSDIYLRKYYKSSDSVQLEENWIPKSDGNPEYTIKNYSDRTIHGTVMGEFWGGVKKYDSGIWEYYKRGGFCGTGAGPDSICPGKSGSSIEGFFIGKPNPFTRGRYKYIVYYSDEEVQMGYRLLKNEAIDKRVWNYYLLEKEFEITDE